MYITYIYFYHPCIYIYIYLLLTNLIDALMPSSKIIIILSIFFPNNRINKIQTCWISYLL